MSLYTLLAIFVARMQPKRNTGDRSNALSRIT